MKIISFGSKLEANLSWAMFAKPPISPIACEHQGLDLSGTSPGAYDLVCRRSRFFEGTVRRPALFLGLWRRSKVPGEREGHLDSSGVTA